jgi:hypothetical protein
VRARARPPLLSLAFVAIAAAVRAQPLPVLRPAGTGDLLRAASLPFEPAHATLLPRGAWSVTASLGYANVWSVSDEVIEVHGALGRSGEPLLSEELRLLERLAPGEDLRALDIEGSRADLFASWGVHERVTVTLQVPFVASGRPQWDGVAEWWHDLTGLPDAGRESFPRGDSLFYLHGPSGTVERRDTDGSGLGDVALAAGTRLGRALGAEHRAVLAVEAPTGAHGTLRGSGGWDAGVRWLALWEISRVELLAGAGYTWTSGDGSLLGIPRADPWHLMAGLDWRVWRGLTATVRVAYERSLLEGFAGGRAGAPALSERIGLAAPLGDRGWIAFEFAEDSASGVAPDFGFHLAVGATIGR